MKKVIFVLFSIILIVGCKDSPQTQSSEETKPISFSQRANKVMRKTIDDRLPHDFGDNPIITEQKALIDGDSAYLCTFNMKYKNTYGGWSSGRFTFAYVKDGSSYRVCLCPKDESIWLGVNDAMIEGNPVDRNYEIAIKFCNWHSEYTEKVME